MSRKVSIVDFTDSQLEKISTDLQIYQESSKYNFSAQSKHICLFDQEDDNVFVPFSYNLNLERPNRNNFTSRNIIFTGQLRDEQKSVKTEAINHLNRDGSTLISAACGFGKCLQKSTAVLMYDGNIKYVENIIIGDLLMGDDSKSRKVLSTCSGTEKMFKVMSSTGESFGCNYSHILTLKIIGDKNIRYHNNKFFVKILDRNIFKFTENCFKSMISVKKFLRKNSNDIIDIHLYDYINLEPDVKKCLRLYKACTEFQDIKTTLSPNEYIARSEQGSIPYEYKCNSIEKRSLLINSIIKYYGKRQNYGYDIVLENGEFTKDVNYIIHSLGIHTLLEKKEKYIIKMFGSIDGKNISQSLFPNFYTIPIIDDTYYGFTLDGNGRFLLGNFTVTHNTAMSIYIASKINLKTLVVCHRIVLINQWKDSIKRFCPNSTVQILNSKSKIQDNDFYIINAVNIPKHNKDFYKDIGFVIVDEAHLIMAEKISRCMRYLLPRYVLGLSATPYRNDGLDILMELYFGKNRIERKLFRRHIVYKICTNIKPDVKLNRMGKVDWGSVIDSISNNIERNEMIISVIKYFKDKVFLVLCKRVSQAEYILKRLIQENENVTTLIGNQQEYKKESRILVGTAQKVGTGFDHPLLNSLILACDVEQYFIQYLGRVFRRNDTVPCIFDFVDNYGLLQKHFKTRKDIYIEHGGEIKDFLKNFPNIFYDKDEHSKY
jgi:superfamily II DNA or RNA helicase